MEIIATTALKPGMFVAELDRPWEETPFLLQGFVIEAPGEISQFQSLCRFVYIDRSRSLGEHYRAHSNDGSPPPKPVTQPLTPWQGGKGKKPDLKAFVDVLRGLERDEDTTALIQEIETITPVFDAVQEAIQHAVNTLESEQEIDLIRIRDGVHTLSESILRNPDAVLWLARLKTVDQYSFDHAMDVSVHLLLFGAHQGWRGEELVHLGIAGLLQDVGKTRLTPELLAKPMELDETERELVRSHVASSLEILIGQKGIPMPVLTIVARHHERWDGSGYPNGLKLKAIGMPAEMAGLVDSFCAMVKHTPYREGIGHQQALESLYQLRDRQFNPALMEQFVQCIGLYPIGTLVELNSGEVAVVIQPNRVQRSRPRVLVLLDAHKQRVVTNRLVDLRHENDAGRRIVRALHHDSFGALSHDYYLG